jgi:hypothetical protein
MAWKPQRVKVNEKATSGKARPLLHLAHANTIAIPRSLPPRFFSFALFPLSRSFRPPVFI